MNVGFSTGSLALGDFASAIKMLENSNTNVIELSALRERELDALLDCIEYLDLKQYRYISFHAPSKIITYSEEAIVKKLRKIIDYGWPIIVHPDVIKDIKLWRTLGSFLCIENMDKRKPIGRTTSDLETIFGYLPDASFCFDLAHVRQVDPTMTEAATMLKKVGHKLKQLHVSDVNSRSIHEPLNLEAVFAFRKISHLINSNIPIVLESPIPKDRIEFEVHFASLIFDDAKFNRFIDSLKTYIRQQSTTNSEYQKLGARITV